MHEKLQENSIHIEAQYDALVENLKQELCSIMRKNQDEQCPGAEERNIEIDKKIILDIREKHFKGRKTNADLKEIEEEEMNMR